MAKSDDIFSIKKAVRRSAASLSVPQGEEGETLEDIFKSLLDQAERLYVDKSMIVVGLEDTPRLTATWRELWEMRWAIAQESIRNAFNDAIRGSGFPHEGDSSSFPDDVEETEPEPQEVSSPVIDFRNSSYERITIRGADGIVATYRREAGPHRSDTYEEVDSSGFLRVPVEELPAYMGLVKRREEQDQKWGEQDHTLPEWMAILGEEYGEACGETNKLYFGGDTKHWVRLRKELEQTAAVCVAILLNMERGANSAPITGGYYIRRLAEDEGAASVLTKRGVAEAVDTGEE